MPIRLPFHPGTHTVWVFGYCLLNALSGGLLNSKCLVSSSGVRKTENKGYKIILGIYRWSSWEISCYQLGCNQRLNHKFWPWYVSVPGSQIHKDHIVPDTGRENGDRDQRKAGGNCSGRAQNSRGSLFYLAVLSGQPIYWWQRWEQAYWQKSGD